MTKIQKKKKLRSYWKYRNRMTEWSPRPPTTRKKLTQTWAPPAWHTLVITNSFALIFPNQSVTDLVLRFKSPHCSKN